MSGSQIRGARSLLDWSLQRLADEAGLELRYCATCSNAQKTLSGYISTAEKLKATLEKAGIVFIDAGPDGGPGVRLAK